MKISRVLVADGPEPDLIVISDAGQIGAVNTREWLEDNVVQWMSHRGIPANPDIRLAGNWSWTEPQVSERIQGLALEPRVSSHLSACLVTTWRLAGPGRASFATMDTGDLIALDRIIRRTSIRALPKAS